LLGNIYKNKEIRKMARVYCIVSGKGGVGKTTSAINLAAALNHLGEDVILVDANLFTPNIGLHLGAPIVPVTLDHIMDGHASLEDAIYEHYSGIKILPSSLSGKNAKKIKIEKIAKIIKDLKKISNHVILDSPPGLNNDVIESIKASDDIILVVNPEMPSVTDSLKTAKLAQDFGKQVRGFILTRHKGRTSEMQYPNIKDMLDLPFLGVVPEDKNIQKALALKDAIFHTHPRSKASKAYKKIAGRLLGKQYIKQIEREERLFNRILRRFGL
jgi:septum site-determining protein MinD